MPLAIDLKFTISSSRRSPERLPGGSGGPGVSGGGTGAPRKVLGDLGGVLAGPGEPLEGVLGASWRALGASWAVLGLSWGVPGGVSGYSWGRLGVSRGDLCGRLR